MTHRRASLRSAVALFAVLGLALVGACGRDTTRGDAEPGGAAAAAPTPSIAFEPAYPSDVSAEGLSPADTTQQETPHSHDGGEPHAHDAKEPATDEEDHGHPH